MTVSDRRPWTLVLLIPLLMAAGSPPHLDLAESRPAADETLAEPPAQIWLAFTEELNPDESTFRVVGPDGVVELGAVQHGDDPKVLSAEVRGAMPPGVYTVQWTAAPLDDHAVRGRFDFFVDVG